MARTQRIALVAALLCTSVAAGAESLSINLRLTVPVHCNVSYSPGGGTSGSDGSVGLGEIREFCNAPQGYELLVNYTPGSLRGAVLVAGNDRVVLNGSGETVVSRVAGPRIQSRRLAATPGANGFDTDQLQFRLRPA